MKIEKRQTHLIFLLVIIASLIPIHIANPNCLVDKCATCANPKSNKCESCETGWYLKTWDNTDKSGSYNDCWSSTYWWWTLLAILFLVLLSFSLCYFMFKVGESKFESEFEIENKFEKNPVENS